jgi:hypothetical protein
VITWSGMPVTHKGWLLFCPIYLDMRDPDDPMIEARWRWATQLLFAALAIERMAVAVLEFIDPDYEPMWWWVITGEVPARS